MEEMKDPLRSDTEYYIYLLSKISNNKHYKYVGVSGLPDVIRKARHMHEIKYGGKGVKWQHLNETNWKFERIYEFKGGETSIQRQQKEEEMRNLHRANLNQRRCVVPKHFDCHLRYMEKNECDCGGKYTTINKKRHEKTIKHQKYIAGIKTS